MSARSLLASMLAALATVGCAAGVEPETPAALDEGALGVAPPAASAGQFGFTTLDVGQGDAAVVVTPGGCAALLDAGPSGSGATIKQYLRSIGIARLDFAVVSHYHADHLGGLDEVERGDDAVPIARVYDHGGAYDTATYAEYERQFRGRRATAARGQAISLCGEVTLHVVASNANGAPTTDENARSVVVKVSYGALDVLVGGDLGVSGPNVESMIAADVGPVEVYKVHHHGSAGSSGAPFLDTIRPTVGFISAAASNSYGHPAPSALARLAAVGAAVWRTEPAAVSERGHLELTTPAGEDGAIFKIAQRGRSAVYRSHP